MTVLARTRSATTWWNWGWAAPLLIGVAVFAIDAFAVPPFFVHPITAGRPDYFYLADAFLHGRLWVDVPWGQGTADLIFRDGLPYTPFQPFPGILLMPLVALAGLQQSIDLEPFVNAALTGAAAALAWVMIGRYGVRRPSDRLALTMLFGFGTVVWNITERGGVWHTAELVAAGLTLWALCETQAERPRPWLLGMLGGAAFLTRSTLVVALPYYAWVVAGSPTDLERLRQAVRRGVRPVAELTAVFVPFVLATLWYDQARFGSPFETGYGLATLPPFLEALREQGLFSVTHLTMNLDYLFLRMPETSATWPWLTPDKLGMSVLFTSPALVVGLRSLADSSKARILALAGLAVLMPTLLYYGGGWVQFGYRYLVDSIPFWLALCAIWAARRGVGLVWWAAVAWSVVVNAWLVYCALTS